MLLFCTICANPGNRGFLPFFCLAYIVRVAYGCHLCKKHRFAQFAKWQNPEKSQKLAKSARHACCHVFCMCAISEILQDFAIFRILENTSFLRAMSRVRLTRRKMPKIPGIPRKPRNFVRAKPCRASRGAHVQLAKSTRKTPANGQKLRFLHDLHTKGRK